MRYGSCPHGARYDEVDDNPIEYSVKLWKENIEYFNSKMWMVRNFCNCICNDADRKKCHIINLQIDVI
jgi:hypothetical protein